jgi:hypothetical protein
MLMLPADVVRSASALTGPPPLIDPGGVTYMNDPAWAGVPEDAARSIARAMMTIPLFERILILNFSLGVARAVKPLGDQIGIPIGVTPALPILPALPSSTAKFDREWLSHVVESTRKLVMPKINPIDQRCY